MARKQNLLKQIEDYVTTPLARTTSRFSESVDEFSWWALEVGRSNSIQGYAAGINLGEITLFLTVWDLHLYPSFLGNIRSRSGTYYGGDLRGESLDELRGFPALLRRFEGIVESEVSTSKPFRGTKSAGDRTRREIRLPDSHEDYILETASSWLSQNLEDSEDLVVSAMTQSHSKPEQWLYAAFPYLCKEMPSLNLETFCNFFKPGPELSPRAVSNHKVFNLDPNDSHLKWIRLYQNFPDTTGLCTFSKIGFNDAKNQALVSVTVDVGFPKGSSGVQLLSHSGTVGIERGTCYSLLLLELHNEEWKVVANKDLRFGWHPEIKQDLNRRDFTRFFENKEYLTQLGLYSIQIKNIDFNTQAKPIRLECEVNRSGDLLQFSVVGNGWSTSGRSIVEDNPVLVVSYVSPENIANELPEFLACL